VWDSWRYLVCGTVGAKLMLVYVIPKRNIYNTVLNLLMKHQQYCTQYVCETTKIVMLCVCFSQEDIHATRPVDPTAKTVMFNPKYEQLFAAPVCHIL